MGVVRGVGLGLGCRLVWAGVWVFRSSCVAAAHDVLLLLLLLFCVSPPSWDVFALLWRVP